MKNKYLHQCIIVLLITLFIASSNAQNNSCEVEEQCIYTVYLESLDNSGWNGNTMTFYQNGEAIKIIGENFTSGDFVSDIIFFCDGVHFQMVWNEGGNSPEQIKVTLLSSNNNVIFIKNYGEGEPNSTLFSGISNCSTDCCFFAPFDLEFISSTETTAQLTWSTTYNPPQYDVFLTTDLSQDAQSNSNPPYITVNSNPAEIIDLLPCTDYKYQVRYRCSEFEHGLWSTESVLFSTECELNLDENKFKNLEIFPNPVADFLTVSNSSEIHEIEIISALGQPIISLKTNQEETSLDLSILPTGIYFLKLKSVDDYETIKIVKK
ncbi:MAG TPA: T9SS type A sorting domain-containing protein [Flavobacterium sp.]|uniref:T9SS type A sorting domain-containing protein n=1 Tax=unclassified Flavobacterium TaxID=196869 RepID=UPI000E9A15DF|nr:MULTISPECIES: T9SS type A sorting domain-containing protein [unclassified Flavobacterium]HBI01170.1 hypothetical protein [Flavobacterium sp.]HRE77611.1 T9SS type A sorting domain-containing protein [Flavobacterium sp.]